MDVKEAVRTAKDYVADLFAEDRPQRLGLEEVTFDDDTGTWQVTVGFVRGWASPLRETLAMINEQDVRTREFKLVTIDNSSSSVKSVKHRVFA